MAEELKPNEPQQPDAGHPESSPAEPVPTTEPARGRKGKKAEQPPKAAPNADLDGLVPGRIVHYVLPDGRRTGEHRPAMVIDVPDPEAGVAHLAVYTVPDQDYDMHQHPGIIFFARATKFDPTAEMQGTWHWIERS
jgi:hypothetical protein